MVKLKPRCTRQTGRRLEVNYKPALLNYKRCSKCLNSKYFEGTKYNCTELGVVTGSYTCDLRTKESKEKKGCIYTGRKYNARTK